MFFLHNLNNLNKEEKVNICNKRKKKALFSIALAYYIFLARLFKDAIGIFKNLPICFPSL